MPVYLDSDRLAFAFPEVHEEARFEIEFQRTFRIPDDGSDYPLPPGFGSFPLRHVDDYAGRVPSRWTERGGVMLPMYQAEAMWISFCARGYPFAVKIATGKINAVTGRSWCYGLKHDPQDYLVLPDQPWLDGYAVEKGIVRQFVAMPLGSGATAEEQITGEAEWGGLQILAYPLRPELYSPPNPPEWVRSERAVLHSRSYRFADMGLAPGGRMRQEVYTDGRHQCDWAVDQGLRCFVSILNSRQWREVTDEPAPGKPISARAYSEAGLPWFDYYSETPAEAGSTQLAAVKPAAAFVAHSGSEDDALTEPVAVARVIKLGPRELQSGMS